MFKPKYRVYYEDTDAGGIMFYGNYLKFAERARTDWLRELGFHQSDMEVLFVVKKVEIEYLAPARLDDEVMVATSVKSTGRASIIMTQDFYVEELQIAKAEIVIVCIDKNFKPTKVPTEITNKMSQ